jgi:hypothetical protein
MALDPIGEASHRLCIALHMQQIDPSEIEITLPFDAWWRMQSRLEQLYRGLMTFDGRGAIPETFKYMGVTYRAKR